MQPTSDLINRAHPPNGGSGVPKSPIVVTQLKNAIIAAETTKKFIAKNNHVNSLKTEKVEKTAEQTSDGAYSLSIENLDFDGFAKLLHYRGHSCVITHKVFATWDGYHEKSSTYIGGTTVDQIAKDFKYVVDRYEDDNRKEDPTCSKL